MKTPLRLLHTGLLLALISLWGARAQAQLTWVTNNGAITITGGCPSSPGAVVIPETINGLPVGTIGDRAFQFCTTLTGITIPNSVIGIGVVAFGSCSSLTNVVIPNSVTSIGEEAFAGCKSLIAIQVDSGNFIFGSVDGVLFDKGKTRLIQFPSGKTGAYTIPSSVTSIGDWAFSSCSSLTKVVIPNSVTSIGGGAFNRCNNLTNLVIPDSVITIGGDAFSESETLFSVTIGNGVTKIPAFAFDQCYSLNTVTFGHSVTEIGEYAFRSCDFTSVVIPDSVTSIGEAAFSSCDRLSNLQLGDGLRGTIHRETFAWCDSLTTVTIPAGITRLVGTRFTTGAFGWSPLTTVYFKGNAPEIEWWAFTTSPKEMTVYYLPGTAGWGPTLDGYATAPWVLPHPLILKTPGNVALQTNGFGFRISWATNGPVVVEATTSLSAPDWSPVSTNTVVDGWVDFRDPAWANHGQRFYRVRGP